MKPRFWLPVLIVIALLAGQHIALGHASWHASGGSAVDAAPDHGAEHSEEGELCKLDLPLSELLGWGGSASPVTAFHDLAGTAFSRARQHRIPAASIRATSRGPPLLP